MQTSVRVPRKPSLGGYRVSAAAVQNAVHEFGLSWPVVIKFSQGRRRLGAHRVKVAGGTFVHSITVTTYFREASDMSGTIWHELTHARQAEQLGLPQFRASYKREQATVGYRNNRFEVEARKEQEARKHSQPLVAGQQRTERPQVRPTPVPTRKPRPTVERGKGGEVGTGQRIAVERKNRKGYTVRVIDGSLDPQWGTQGGRWITVNVDTGNWARFSGKRDAKAAVATA